MWNLRKKETCSLCIFLFVCNSINYLYFCMVVFATAKTKINLQIMAKWTLEAVQQIKEGKKPGSSKAIPTETANGMTKNIIRAVNMRSGCVAYRINNVGIWDEKKQIHRRANTEKGLPDIWGCVHGRLLTIEVKAGSDKMSEHQLFRKVEIERAGGLYCEAKSTDAALAWFNEVEQSERAKIAKLKSLQQNA